LFLQHNEGDNDHDASLLDADEEEEERLRGDFENNVGPSEVPAVPVTPLSTTAKVTLNKRNEKKRGK